MFLCPRGPCPNRDSYMKLHAITTDDASGGQHGGAFGGILQQNRIGVVDMHVNPVLHVELTQDPETSIRTRNWNVAHLRGDQGSCTATFHFIFGPEGTIEKEDITVAQQIVEFTIDNRNIRQKH